MLRGVAAIADTMPEFISHCDQKVADCCVSLIALLIAIRICWGVSMLNINLFCPPPSRLQLTFSFCKQKWAAVVSGIVWPVIRPRGVLASP